MDDIRGKVRAILLARWVLDPTQDLEETLDEIDAAYRNVIGQQPQENGTP